MTLLTQQSESIALTISSLATTALGMAIVVMFGSTQEIAAGALGSALVVGIAVLAWALFIRESRSPNTENQ
jgi:hypothetical protein